VTCLAGCDNV